MSEQNRRTTNKRKIGQYMARGNCQIDLKVARYSNAY